MAGGSVFTTVGHDEFVRILMENLTYFKFGEGGFVLSGETIEVIDAGASGGNDTYDYTVTGGDFEIIGVSQGSKTFTVDDDYQDYFPVGARISVEGSTGNDGRYTVAGVSLSSGDTVVEVDESIPDATVDGDLYVDHLPIAKGPTSDTRHWPLVVEERTPGGSLVQSITDTTGTGTLTGDGSGTINYKTGALHVEFDSDVASGNNVKVKFKYHDAYMDATLGQGFTDLEAESSAIMPDGLHELYSYTKEFGGGSPPDTAAVITFRGVGYGTIRCTIRLKDSEGIDDGRALTYGGTPYFFEAGIFSSDDVMVAYMTFDKERHSGANVIEHTCDIIA